MRGEGEMGVPVWDCAVYREGYDTEDQAGARGNSFPCL